MTLTVIESPFAGRGPWPLSWLRRLRNVRYARRCLQDSLSRGEAPIASHLLYPQVLRDGRSRERWQGIEAGLAWAQRADLVAVYWDLGVSEGMADAIEAHHRRGATITYRELG